MRTALRRWQSLPRARWHKIFLEYTYKNAMHRVYQMHSIFCMYGICMHRVCIYRIFLHTWNLLHAQSAVFVPNRQIWSEIMTMGEEEKIKAGILFNPADPELKEIKRKTHDLNIVYNNTYEEETEKRASILADIIGELGEGSMIQGPIAFHYGRHTRIGKCFFGNFNLTIQDDAEVTIGDNCNFGPNVTIVTPIHPMLAAERREMLTAEGKKAHLCYAKPVKIGNDCWFGASVTVCPGVTIGDNCVIGAGSVVTRDIPSDSFAAGVPCRVIRKITEADSMKYKPEILADNIV